MGVLPRRTVVRLRPRGEIVVRLTLLDAIVVRLHILVLTDPGIRKTQTTILRATAALPTDVRMTGRGGRGDPVAATAAAATKGFRPKEEESRRRRKRWICLRHRNRSSPLPVPSRTDGPMPPTKKNPRRKKS